MDADRLDDDDTDADDVSVFRNCNKKIDNIYLGFFVKEKHNINARRDKTGGSLALVSRERERLAELGSNSRPTNLLSLCTVMKGRL